METPPTLGQLIERFLKPIKGRSAQVELTRLMTRHLKIEPDSVRGFPTILSVRATIKKELAHHLLEQTQVKPGDEVTYFGRKRKVVRVHYDGLTLDQGLGKAPRSVVSPFYCAELLEKVGVKEL